jgi:23S rRNA pseudouridine2605 synthase
VSAPVSLARALSKLGHCSRAEGVELVRAGRVRVNGRVRTDPETRIDPARDRIEVDGARIHAVPRVYIALNKPRGLVTTAADERGRDTVYACLDDASLPRVVPVGRLDRASEGLLLFTSDTRWADRIADPATHLPKTYHVQIDRMADDALLALLREGIDDAGERLTAVSADLLRSGGKTSWLEIVLDEGKNRQIRRMLAACGAEVLRLVRISIGPLALGDLPSGRWRRLSPDEKAALDRAMDSAAGEKRGRRD